MSTTTLTFRVLGQNVSLPPSARNEAFLNFDKWDDWGEYCTQFYLTLVDEKGNQHAIGNVKIGQYGLRPHSFDVSLPDGHRMPDIPPQPFATLGENQFSLGQDDSYYERLKNLGQEIRISVLSSLKDAAFDPTIWQKAKEERVMERSLLRSITQTMVERQFTRIAQGGARLTFYKFSFNLPPPKPEEPPSSALTFYINHYTKPPSNIHVLIGRNGMGKSHLLSLMANSLVRPDPAGQYGKFSWEPLMHAPPLDASYNFANVVVVSFSAFDEKGLPEQSEIGEINYTYIGLQHKDTPAESTYSSKNLSRLTKDFIKSLTECQSADRKKRWLDAIQILESDPIIKDDNIKAIIELNLTDQDQEVSSYFRNLSSGHKIVLLTITQLIERTEEKSLILLDEPESHLHPPLLASFIRAVSTLLIDRNGVAIISTHSPVILQEVPSNCVWKIRRINSQIIAERPEIETFGENVGTLTREVFTLEITKSGFHQMLRDAVSSNDSYENALLSFKGNIGSEGRAILRSLCLPKASS